MGLFGSNDITAVDIGAGSVKVVRVTRGRRPKLLAARIVETALGPEKENSVAATLRYLRMEKKLWSRHVYTMVPGKFLTIRHITLPKMPQAELREAVRWESKRHISYPLDAAMIEYLIVGEKHEGPVEKYDILMVAVERAAVNDHLAPFHEAGINVRVVDANPLALRNVLRQQGKTGSANIMVVDIGAAKTEINIYKDGSLRFSRCLETGGADIMRAVAEELGIGLQNALVIKRKLDVLAPPEEDKAVAAIRGRLDGILLEIRRSVEYYKTSFREKGVEQTVLTGGVPLMSGLKEYFSMAVDSHVELDNPFTGLSGKKSVLEEYGQHAPRFSAVIGLALRKA